MREYTDYLTLVISSLIPKLSAVVTILVHLHPFISADSQLSIFHPFLNGTSGEFLIYVQEKGSAFCVLFLKGVGNVRDVTVVIGLLGLLRLQMMPLLIKWF